MFLYSFSDLTNSVAIYGISIMIMCSGKARWSVLLPSPQASLEGECLGRHMTITHSNTQAHHSEQAGETQQDLLYVVPARVYYRPALKGSRDRIQWTVEGPGYKYMKEEVEQSQ